MVAMRRYTDAKAWDTFIRLNSGMNQAAERLGRDLLENTLADWAKRIQAGEVPAAPPRPTGMERNFVVTQWDWANKDSFIHDVISHR